ncbi:hypothetical protein SAMN05421734_101392 [Pelagirhabdus alkalitolerans]|uniref:Schlafen group 3-like DNA/RNA helicase domain-containing protein n=1 Tax=Pelagirhabdus alkalitolerans TaxID=1612202 RepID=A0A1G6GQH3_9BACI|nr:hypothetical protein SAMN05421734_101392 [Pelagirhabdus alkalitolerans]
MIKDITSQYQTTDFYLDDQFRIQADDRVPNWIDAFIDNHLLPIPNNLENFEFKIFNNSQDIKQAIFKKNETVGLSRLVSTFDYTHKKDGNSYIVDEGGIDLPWNHTDAKKTWAEEASTVNEVGSIYTVQGFDLNYVGVIIGPSISYDDERDQLIIRPEEYKDTEAYRKRKDLTEDENEQLKLNIILNSLNVLM